MTQIDLAKRINDNIVGIKDCNKYNKYNKYKHKMFLCVFIQIVI